MAVNKRYTVCGAGNGGHAMAAELALKGYDVKVFDFPEFENALIPIREKKGITVLSDIDNFTNGKGEHFADIPIATTDADEALADTDIVMIVAPAYAHDRFINEFCGRLRNGQTVVLNPGGLGGAIQFKAALQNAGTPDVRISETATMLYSCRLKGPAHVHVGGKKIQLLLGTFPNVDTPTVLESLKDAYPEFVPAKNALETGFSRPSIAMHPVPVIMNTTKIEQMGAYAYKAYDITPTIARVIEAIDRERMEILETLDMKPAPLKDMLTLHYGTTGKDFYETVTHVPAYQNHNAPPEINYRYITEDVPFIDVPAVQLGNALGIPVPMLTAVVHFANAMLGTDFWQSGRSLEKLGLAGLSKEQIIEFLETGKK